jgi:heme-degrading monooxygenase HmoA
MPAIAQTPEGPYYAVIFSSLRTPGDQGYGDMAARMEELAADQPGFLGIESARGTDGLGVTVSYWRSLEDLQAWKRVEEHRSAQRLGRERWYEQYRVRVVRLEYDYGFDRPAERSGPEEKPQAPSDERRARATSTST